MTDERFRAYVDKIGADHRPLFDRVHSLIVEVRPDAEVGLAYGVPSYRVGGRRLYVGVWKHGLSIYGWADDRDDGFSSRHPELRTSKGTLRLSPGDAAAIPDEELRGLVRAALDT